MLIEVISLYEEFQIMIAYEINKYKWLQITKTTVDIVIISLLLPTVYCTICLFKVLYCGLLQSIGMRRFCRQIFLEKYVGKSKEQMLEK